jgi:hypothetical protein
MVSKIFQASKLIMIYPNLINFIRKVLKIFILLDNKKIDVLCLEGNVGHLPIINFKIE